VQTTLVPAVLEGTDLGRQVLAPGGVFCGSDNPGRGLEFRAGLEQARIRTGSRIVFHAHRPH
jgi:hypothetical protein